MTFPNSFKKVKRPQRNDGSVAIIMRTKDRPILLVRAFISVLSQTYENWHLYLVNDGGLSDGVEKIAAQNQAAFRGRLTVIHHGKKRGMESASNSALGKSKGEFLIVHDDDDSWHPEFLEKTVGFLNEPQNSAFAAVVTSVYVVHEKIMGDRLVELSREIFQPWGSEIDFSSMLVRNLYPPISMLVRRSIVNAAGGFNQQLPVLGDWDFNIRVLKLGDIGTIPERLAFWHWREKVDNEHYQNSIYDVNKLHEKYDVLYRNSSLRSAFKENPEMMGVVQALSRRIDQTENKVIGALNQRIDLLDKQLVDIKKAFQQEALNQRFDRLEAAVMGTQLLIHKLLGPPRWVFGLTHPLRKWMVKFYESRR